MYCYARLRPTSGKPTRNPETGNTPYFWVERRSVGFGAPEKKTFIAVGMSKCKAFNKQFYQVIVVQVIVFIKCTKFQ